MVNLLDVEELDIAPPFDDSKERFTLYQAAMLWSGRNPLESFVRKQDCVSKISNSQLEDWLINCQHVDEKVNRSFGPWDIFIRLKNAVENGDIKALKAFQEDGSLDPYRTVVRRGNLVEFAKEWDGIPEFLIDGPVESVNEPERPMPRQRFQENEILWVIRELGHDPRKLPKNKPGKPGVRSEVCKMLTDPMWQGTVFEKAWERLSQKKEIEYES